MANEAEVFGLPEVYIDFKTKGATAIKRSARGIVAMLLKNEETNTSKTYKINDVADIPETGLTAANVDLIKKCLLGTPLRVLVYTLPLDTVQPKVTQDEGGQDVTEDMLYAMLALVGVVVVADIIVTRRLQRTCDKLLDELAWRNK